MKKLIYLVLIIGAVVSLWSCKDSKESEKVVDEFYGYLIDGKYESTIDQCSDVLWKNHDKDEWLNAMLARNDDWGSPKSWESTYTGFKTSKIGKITELRFEVTNEGGKTYETFEFIEEDGKMKFVKYTFTGNSDYVTIDEIAVVDDIPVFKTEETTIDKFYRQYDKNDFTTLADFLTKKNTNPEDVEVYITQFHEKFNRYGKIKKIEKTDAVEFGEENDKGIAIFYKITYENGEVLFEKFEFSAVDEIGLIQYYNWAKDPKKL